MIKTRGDTSYLLLSS